MCILIHHPSNVSFSDELLNDFYDHNSDGFGAMYAEGGKLVVVKTLGKPQEINALYKDALKGRECIIHYRMKTHGDIDMENCHPYKVTDDIWMAHNGILSMGNPIDKTKSDTWHFIKFILRPALEANPMLIFDLDYQDYLEKVILKMNYKSFTQIVILGSASFTPFMQLPQGHRREVIEDILDIQIFTTMNTILKNRLTTTKTELSQLENEIAVCVL